MSWLSRRRRRIEFVRRQVPAISRRKFVNPLFPKKENRGFWGGRPKYYCICLLIGLFYFFFFSGTFGVNAVIIKGINYLSEEAIRPMAEDFINSRRWIIIPQNNLILTGTEILTNKINEQLSGQFALSSLAIQKNFPSTIEIIITERVPSLTWVTNNLIYYIDLEGKATKKLEEDEPLDLNFPKIYDLENKEISLNEPVISATLTNYLFDITNNFNTIISNSQIDSFQYSQIVLPDLWLNTKEGWKIFLDTQRPASEQINQARMIIDQFFSKDRQDLDYIDVRLEDRAYYKIK